MFLVRYYDSATSTYKVHPLKPAPSEVEYPDRMLFTAQSVKDGGVVRQRSLRDSRTRQWTWKGYRPVGPSMQNFTDQWELLESLDVKARWTAGYTDTTVQVWEDQTEEGGFGNTTNGAAPDLVSYTNIKWTTVEFQQVTKKTRKGGGRTTYDTATVEFVIVDANYEAF